jgi:hypothetical protein
MEATFYTEEGETLWPKGWITGLKCVKRAGESQLNMFTVLFNERNKFLQLQNWMNEISYVPVQKTHN